MRYLGKQDRGQRSSSELYNVAGRADLDTTQVLQIYGLHVLTWIIVLLPLIFSGVFSDIASTVAATLMIAAMAFWIWIVPGVLYKAK